MDRLHTRNCSLKQDALIAHPLAIADTYIWTAVGRQAPWLHILELKGLWEYSQNNRAICVHLELLIEY